MLKFEVKPFGERIRIIWKSLMSLKEVFYMSLVFFALISVTIIIFTFVTNDKGISEELGLHPIVAYSVFFVSIFVFLLFIYGLANFGESNRLIYKHTWQYLITIPQCLTLRKSNGTETVINQSEILSIYLLEPKETKKLIESRMRPIWHDVKLNVLKIKLHREDYCVILDVYDDARQIVVELNELYPIEGITALTKESIA